MNSAHPFSNTEDVPEIAKLAVKNNILTEEQVRKAMAAIAEENNRGRVLSFEDYLQESRLVSEDTLSRLLAATVRHLDKAFGALAVRMGVLGQDEVAKALAAQKKAFKQGTLMPISDILMKWNYLTIRQRDKLLEAMEIGMPPRSHRPAPPKADEDKDSLQAPSPQTHSTVAQETQDVTDPPQDQVPHPADTSVHRPEEDTSQGNNEEETREPALFIDFSEQSLEAVLHIPEGIDTAPTLNSVKELMIQYDITNEAAEAAQLEQHQEKLSEAPASIVVAKGIRPVPGKSSTLTLHFNNDYLNPGKITEDGAIDFRERGSVPFVSEGTLLAVKTPAVKGTPGKDVFGRVIPVDEVEDLSFKAGTGTTASEDGLSVCAATEGQPFMTVHGEICVFKELHIKGDVDYSTGNISFDGNIFVKGSIKEGFTVKGGNLTAKDVQGATLDIKGNINVSGGILDTKITVGGNLQAMYMSGSKVDAYGDVMIKKEIIDSKVRASGVFSSDQLNVISSFVSAKQGIDVKRIGTDVSKPCTLRIGISDHTNKIIKNMKLILDDTKKKLAAKQEEIEKFKARLQKSQQQIMEKAITQDRLSLQKTAIQDKIHEISNDPERNDYLQKLETLLSQTGTNIKDLDDTVDGLFKQQDQLTDAILYAQEQCEVLVMEIEDLNTRIKEVKNWDKKTNPMPRIRVSKEIQAQTSISGSNSIMILKDTHRNVTIRETRRADGAGVTWDLVIDSN